MDQDKLDQIFRSELHNHTTVLDKDSLWASIDKQQKKRSTKFFSLKLLSLLAAIAMATLYFLDSSTDFRANETLAPVENYSTEAPVQANVETTKKENNNPKIIKSKITNSSLSTFPKEVNDSVNQKINNTKNSNNTTATNQSNTTKSTAQYTANHAYTAPAVTQNNYESSTSSLSPVVNSSSSTNNAALLSAQTSTTALDKQVTELMTPLSLDMQSLTPLNYNRPLFIRNDKVECYDHRKKVHPFYLEVYSSVDFIKNWLSANDNEELSYLNERKATQTQLQGYRAGLRLKYLTRSGLYLKTGIELGAIRERFDRSETTEKTEILPNQLLETITQADTTIYIYGDAPVTIIETTSWKVWNTYKTVGIPLLLGYQTELKKFNLGIEFGAIYNMLYSFEGMLLDETLAPTMDPDFFKDKINTSLTGGLSLGYKLNSRYTAMAYTSFKHNMSDINNQYNPISQSNSKIGLGLGLEVKL